MSWELRLEHLHDYEFIYGFGLAPERLDVEMDYSSKPL